MESTEFLQVIKYGRELEPDLVPSLDAEDLVRFYKYMVLLRRLNERTLSLQRQGRVGFCVDSSGNEACQVGCASALEAIDWLFPYYRDSGLCLLKGISLKEIMDHVMSNADDTSKGRQLGVHWTSRKLNVVSSSSCVANRLSHAVGTAYAIKYRNEKGVCLASLGEGSTSQGEFHSAMNFAGVWKVPVVFFCQNNQYAISLPFKFQTASDGIAIKAHAYGFEGVQVDGNDVLAVYKATKAAVEKARSGGGPILIEAVTYRLGGHSSSDDPNRYRTKEELDYWRRRDPLLLFKHYLEKRGLLDKSTGAKIAEDAENELLAAIRASEGVSKPDISTIFSDVYAETPWHIREEADQARGSD